MRHSAATATATLERPRLDVETAPFEWPWGYIHDPATGQSLLVVSDRLDPIKRDAAIAEGTAKHHQIVTRTT